MVNCWLSVIYIMVNNAAFNFVIIAMVLCDIFELFSFANTNCSDKYYSKEFIKFR